MNNRTLISDLVSHLNKEVAVSGFVETRRNHGKIIFLDIRDRTGVVQGIVSTDTAIVYKEAQKLRFGSVVSLKGRVNARPSGMENKDLETGSVEMEITDLKIVTSAAELPFDLEAKLSLETELDHRPLVLRSKKNRHISKTTARIIASYRAFLSQEQFIEFQAPVIVGGDAEGGSDVFQVDYFDNKAYLATSPQLYKQIMVGVHERVFTTTHVFRAERHDTSRHLNEYTSLDAEFGFIEDHTSVMDMLENTIRAIAEDLQDLVQKPALPKKIPQLKLKEAQALLDDEGGFSCSGSPDLAPEHERWISNYVLEKWKSDFVFITHYPCEKRPFYTFEDPEDAGYTRSFDLLFRGLEVATGGQRVHMLDQLERQMERKGLDKKRFTFYLEAFQFGMPPHGGWGMGLERLVARFLNLENVRQATLFPRDMKRIDTLLTPST